MFRGIFSGIGTALAAIMGAIAGAAAALLITIFAYEGLTVPFPFTDGIEVFAGKMGRARDEAREKAEAACAARIGKSIDDASRRDVQIAHDRMQRSAIEAREANERALAAQLKTREYADEIAQLEPALRKCREPTDSDWKRLQ